MMDQREILARVDHTILTPTATWEQVKAVCDEGKQLGVASVCIPPRYVKRANDYAGGGLKICTVVGFPNGYATPEVKVFETKTYMDLGCDEIDMWMNIAALKNGEFDYVLKDIRAVRAVIERGVQVRNQTVLLRGVNDDSAALGSLLSGLTRIGAAPYYIFQCRPVTGVKGRFQVPLQEGVRIVDSAKALQNGFGKSVRYAMSHPRGKIEIFCQLPNGETVFKFHQSRDDRDISRAFTRRLSPADTWLDGELNGI